MTLYEILGYLKDKNPIKKFKIFDEIFTYDEELEDYFDSEGCSLFDEYCWLDDLNTKAEILEITIKCAPGGTIESYHKKIEKLNKEEGHSVVDIMNKINELIDEVNYINERI